MSHHQPNFPTPPSDHDLLVRIDEGFGFIREDLQAMTTRLFGDESSPDSGVLGQMHTRIAMLEEEKKHREGFWRGIARFGKVTAVATPLSAVVLFIVRWLQAHVFAASR